MKGLRRNEERWTINIYNQFKTGFKKSGLNWYAHSAGYYTKAIMKFLGCLAKKRNRKPYSKYHKHLWEKDRYGEYMVDMCWVEKRTEKFIDVAIEEEWSARRKNKDRLMWDFEKLTDIKAYVKVFIFAPRESDIEFWLENFQRRITEHKIKLKEEVYLIIALTRFEKDMTRIAGWIISKAGAIRKLATKEY